MRSSALPGPAEPMLYQVAELCGDALVPIRPEAKTERVTRLDLDIMVSPSQCLSSPRAVKPWRIRRTTRSHEPQRKHMQRRACGFGRSSARQGAGTAAPMLLVS